MEADEMEIICEEESTENELFLEDETDAVYVLTGSFDEGDVVIGVFDRFEKAIEMGEEIDEKCGEPRTIALPYTFNEIDELAPWLPPLEWEPNQSRPIQKDGADEVYVLTGNFNGDVEVIGVFDNYDMPSDLGEEIDNRCRESLTNIKILRLNEIDEFCLSS